MKCGWDSCGVPGEMWGNRRRREKERTRVRGRRHGEPDPRKGALVRQRLTATVHGVVQGVFFRQAAQREAVRLGLVGTVRNQPNGTVRVVAEGEAQALKDFLQWLHCGPERAGVTRVAAEWEEPRGGPADFHIES